MPRAATAPTPVRCAQPVALLATLTLLGACQPDHQAVGPGWRKTQRSADLKLAQGLGKTARRIHRLTQRDALDLLVNRRTGRWTRLWQGTRPVVLPRHLRQLQRLEVDPELADAERRKVRYLRLYLAFLGQTQQTAQDRDLLEWRAMSEPWVHEGRVRARGLMDLRPLLIAADGRPERNAMQVAQAEALGEVQALIEEHDQAVQKALAVLRLRPYDLAEDRAERHSPSLLRLAKRALAADAQLFAQIWKAMVLPEVPAGQKVTLTDLYFLKNGALLRHMLPEDVLLAALARLERGLGFDGGGEGAAGSDAGAASSNLPRLRPGHISGLVAPDPPRDVRLVHGLQPGLDDAVRLFELAGQGICRRSVGAEVPWELRILGPPAGEKALGYLLGLVWLDPAWWGALAEGEVLRLSAEQVQDLLRYRVLSAALRLRIHGVVMPVLRIVRQGGPERDFAAVWDRHKEWIQDPKTQQTGLNLTTLFLGLLRRYVDDGVRIGGAPLWVFELPPLQQHLDLQAWILAFHLQQHLHKTYGARWFDAPAAGRYLVKTLCAGGRSGPAETLARGAGLFPLDESLPATLLGQAWQAVGTLGKAPSDTNVTPAEP